MSAMRAQGLAAHEKARLLAAACTLAALAALLACLQACQAAAPRHRAADALEATSDAALESGRQAIEDALFPLAGFELTGYSEDPPVFGAVTGLSADAAIARIESGMRDRGWVSCGQDASGMYVFACEGAGLARDVRVSCAFVFVGAAADGGSTVLVELV